MYAKVKEILEEIRPDIDFDKEKALIDDHVLESFDLLAVVAEFEDVFDIKIRPKDFISSNFNSIEAITALLEKLVNK